MTDIDQSLDKKFGSSRLRPWEILDSKKLVAAPPWVELWVQQIKLPNGKIVDDYYQIKLPEYTVIFAETAEGRVIVERQYKHGVGKVTLSLPAGSIEVGESPLKAAQRELLEETGYSSSEWASLGTFTPNGNYGCGLLHMFRARQSHKVAEPDSGDLEEMEILLIEPGELVDSLRQGNIDMLSTAAAIALATSPLLN